MADQLPMPKRIVTAKPVVVKFKIPESVAVAYEAFQDVDWDQYVAECLTIACNRLAHEKAMSNIPKQ